MSQSDKNRRKRFLNDLSAKFGINNPTDPRRSDAALAFIAYGERNCRLWLVQADGNYANTERRCLLISRRRDRKSPRLR